MKSPHISEIKGELKELTKPELMELTLRLARFKKENKELLNYLLFEVHDEEGYVDKVKEEISILFDEMNTSSYFFIKKSLRKILRIARKYIRYSVKKETEVELLLFYCQQLKDMTPSYTGSKVVFNIYERQIDAIQKALSKLHEDVQMDYQSRLDDLLESS